MNLDWQRDLYEKYQEGYQAYQKGKQHWQNPYSKKWPGRYNYSCWHDGWFEAFEEDWTGKKEEPVCLGVVKVKHDGSLYIESPQQSELDCIGISEENS